MMILTRILKKKETQSKILRITLLSPTQPLKNRLTPAHQAHQELQDNKSNQPLQAHQAHQASQAHQQAHHQAKGIDHSEIIMEVEDCLIFLELLSEMTQSMINPSSRTEFSRKLSRSKRRKSLKLSSLMVRGL